MPNPTMATLSGALPVRLSPRSARSCQRLRRMSIASFSFFVTPRAVDCSVVVPQPCCPGFIVTGSRNGIMPRSCAPTCSI